MYNASKEQQVVHLKYHETTVKIVGKYIREQTINSIRQFLISIISVRVSMKIEALLFLLHNFLNISDTTSNGAALFRESRLIFLSLNLYKKGKVNEINTSLSGI